MSQYVYFDETKEPKIIGVDKELMAMADQARHWAGIPFIVTSGKRSEEDNAAAGGVVDSAHVAGKALDLRCRDSFECFRIVSSFLRAGAQRIVIGIKEEPQLDGSIHLGYHNIHIDNDMTKPNPILSIKKYG